MPQRRRKSSRQRGPGQATPDLAGPARVAVWEELVSADVDHVSTDDLAGLEAFLRRGRR